MDLEFTEDQELLRTTVARFLAERAPLASFVRPLMGTPGKDETIHAALSELGVFGLLVPESSGGAAVGLTEIGVVAEELGRAVYPGPFLGSAVAAATILSRFGSDRLDELAAGAWLPTLAIHEPGRRYNLTPTARLSGDRITGVKRAVLDGLVADAYVVSTDGGLALIDRDAPGVTVTPEDSVDATRPTATVAFADSPAATLATGAEADHALGEAVDRVTIALVLDGVGAGAAGLELARQYSLERQQFGKPIGSFQAVQHLLVDVLTALETTRAGAYYALWAADEAEPAERRRAASLVKAQASHVFPGIGADSLQVFGGLGFTWEHDIHLFYKRLVSAAHLYGDEDFHLDQLARIVIDQEVST